MNELVIPLSRQKQIATQYDKNGNLTNKLRRFKLLENLLKPKGAHSKSKPIVSR